jgi:hypothetical protein
VNKIHHSDSANRYLHSRIDCSDNNSTRRELWT